MWLNSDIVRTAVLNVSLALVLISFGRMLSSEEHFLASIGWGCLDGAIFLCVTYPVFKAIGNVKSEMWITYWMIFAVMTGSALSTAAQQLSLSQPLELEEMFRSLGRVGSIGLTAILIKPRPPRKRSRRKILTGEIERLLSRLKRQLRTSPAFVKV